MLRDKRKEARTVGAVQTSNNKKITFDKYITEMEVCHPRGGEEL